MLTKTIRSQSSRPRAPLPNSHAVRRMQNRWDNQIHQPQAPAMTDSPRRNTDRWGTENQSVSDSLRPTTTTSTYQSSGKSKKIDSSSDCDPCYLAVKLSHTSDNHTVPSNQLTRPALPIDPFSSSNHHHHSQTEPQIFSRTTFHQQHSPNHSSTRTEFSPRPTTGQENATNNGPLTITVKEPRVTASKELSDVVIKAIDSKCR